MSQLELEPKPRAHAPAAARHEVDALATQLRAFEPAAPTTRGKS